MSRVSSVALPEKLLWLADAPLFIDEAQIQQFYNAVVWPRTTTGRTVLQFDEEAVEQFTAEMGAEGGMALGDFGGLLSALVKPELKVKGSGKGEDNGQKQGRRVELLPVDTPQKLVALTLHYVANHHKRLFLPLRPSESNWRDPTVIRQLPRALVFLDLPGESSLEGSEVGTKLIPTAAEFENGKVLPVYNTLRSKAGQAPPPYPELEAGASDPALLVRRKSYWKWFDDYFSPTRSMLSIEDAAKEHGRIRWIDYRLPITQEGDTLHLHFAPSGMYDTGVFAYYLVKRGYKHGLRLVGTLKAEPDLNVLAVYEK